MNGIRQHLFSLLMNSHQHTKEGRARAQHLADCLRADATLGIVEVPRNAAWTGSAWSWPVPRVAELAVREGQAEVGVALFKRHLTPDEARLLAAQLIDAAWTAGGEPSRVERRAAMSTFWASREAEEKAQSAPTDLLGLLGAM